MLDQGKPTWNAFWIIAEQNADRIFLLCDLTLQIRDLSVRGIEHLLGLEDIQLRGDTVLETELRQLHRISLCGDCFMCNLQLQVQLQKSEVVVRHIR